MLCYRCGSHVPDGTEACAACGQKFALGLKPGPIAGFGTGTRRHRIAVETSPFKVGEVLAGRFEIREHVGAGPAGWVYKCQDRDLDVDVAVKVISPRLLQTEDERRKLSAELRRVRKLAHPNIVRVYEDGHDQGRPFFTMQHLEGLTLRRICDLRRQKGQAFDARELEPIVSQIAQALDHAHAQGLSHGALKPDNVLVLPDLLKLTDFGLANALPRAPFMAAQKAGGVHRYLAPEFLHGERIDPRADVFSLGAIVGEMLSGVAFEPTLDLAARNPALPVFVVDAFRRATAVKPPERFASAGEFVQALTGATEAAPARASVPRPPPAPSRPPPPSAIDERELTDEFDDADMEEVQAVTPPAPVEAIAPEPVPTPAPKSEPAPAPRPAPKPAPPVAKPAPAPVAKPAPRPAPPRVEHRPKPPSGRTEPAWTSRGDTQILSGPPTELRREPTSKAPMVVAGILVAIIALVFLYLAWKAEGQRIAAAGELVPKPAPVAQVVPPAAVDAGVVADAGVEHVEVVPEPEPPPEPEPVKVVEEKPKGPSADELAREASLREERRQREEEKRRRDEAVARLAALADSAEKKREERAVVTATPKAPEPEPAIAKEPTCPRGMRLIDEGSFPFGAPDTDDLKNFGEIDQKRVTTGAYCIDVYEYPNGARRKPRTGVSFTAAEASCKARSKRLCTEQEWERACKGPSSTRYPYGSSFDGDACNTEDSAGNARQASFAGAYSKCRSGYGVFDLTGNVGEWVDARFNPGSNDRTVKGGAADRPDFATRCAARVGKAPSRKDPLIGFRCCSDPE